MSYRSHTLSDFLAAVASASVTPAGGTAAAIVGATGASLCEMGCIHTIAKDGHADVESQLATARDDLESTREQLLALADSDAAAVDALVTDTGDCDRQTDVERATTVPLSIAEACLDVLDRATVVTAKGTATALPDAGTGVLLANTALQAAVFTVRTNITAIDDADFVAEMERRTAEIEAAAETALEEAATNLGEPALIPE